MIKIETAKVGYTPSTSRSKKTSRSSSSFTLNDVDTAISMSSPSSVQTMDALSHLMGLQEIQAQTSQQTIRDYGEQILNALDQFKMDLLNNTVTVDKMKAMADGLQRIPKTVDDSPLQNVIAEIEQRLAVEVAKIEMSQK